MRISRKPMSTRKPVRAADETIEDMPPVEDATPGEGADTDVDPAATDLLFETEDVAQLLAEVTDSEVTADVDEDTDSIVFTVNDEEYVVEPEGTEEMLEASTRVLRSKRAVKASSARNRLVGARRRAKRK